MNVNVTYSGYTLADAASCVMMRLPVPDLVWDMEVLWKVWNEPLPAVDVPEAAPADAQEPVRRRGGERFVAKPVTYAGKEYPSIAALAKAYGISYGMAQARLKRGQPLDMPYCGGSPKGGKKVTIGDVTYPTLTAAAKALGMSVGALWKRLLKGQEARAPLRPVRKPCMLDGRKYPTLTTYDDILGVSQYKAKKNVDECGRRM